MFTLRLLDPQKDYELFATSYNWRTPKPHLQRDRIPFEAFTADDPRQTVIGLFNGEFIAVFLLYEAEPKHFDCHMSSKRGTPKELLIEGGKAVAKAFFENGAEELFGWINRRNVALKGYLEALGFSKENSCENENDLGTLSETPIEAIKYALRREIP